MTKKLFIKQLTEFCDFKETDLKLETKFKTIEGFDSMAKICMIAFVDENFNTKITGAQIEALTDFKSLINLIGEDKFQDD